MTAGAIALTRDGDEIDILMKDAVGLWSARADSGIVVPLDADQDYISVLVLHPKGAKELFTFDLKRKKLVWSQHKFGVSFDKGMTLIADCR